MIERAFVLYWSLVPIIYALFGVGLFIAYRYVGALPSISVLNNSYKLHLHNRSDINHISFSADAVLFVNPQLFGLCRADGSCRNDN